MFNRIIKPEIRIVAWDDVHFAKDYKGYVTLVGPVFRGGKYLDGMLSTKIKKDGIDSTEQLIKTIVNSRNYDQLSIIMLNGITFGGFNVVNIKELSQKTKLPVIVIQRRKPDIKKFRETLKIFSDYKKRLKAAKTAGCLFKFKKIYYQKTGISNKDAEKILEITCIRSDIPEPLRVAHIIASGLSGESRGRV